jgi:hypothetical protein
MRPRSTADGGCACDGARVARRVVSWSDERPADDSHAVMAALTDSPSAQASSYAPRLGPWNDPPMSEKVQPMLSLLSSELKCTAPARTWTGPTSDRRST